MGIGRRLWEVGVLLSGLALWAMIRPEPELVRLFPLKMDADCVRDARPVLQREEIPFRLTPGGDGFEVRRGDRARAQVALVLEGLPRHRVETRRDPGVMGFCGPSGELVRERARNAEALIARVVPVLPGVQSARVKIRRADELPFAEDPKPSQVRIWLRFEGPTSAKCLAAAGRLAMMDYEETNDPIDIVIRDERTGRLLWSDTTDEKRLPAAALDIR